MTRRPSRFLFRGVPLFLALAVLGGSGVNPTPGHAGEKVTPISSPILEVKIQDNFAEPKTPVPTVALDPFFVIREEGARVRVRRVQVALEFLQPDMLPKFDPQSPALREKVYDFLLAEEQAVSGREKKEQEKILAQLVNRYLGQEAVSAVKVDQSFLLLR
ncbi:MAG: hypothetical protein PHU44_09455 [Syntrophales bacterium]|nr:hypothetical protein [Syntrophales bacterium]MDD5641043.1 hypothetical protein [Syntrophales bacterium]